MTEVLSYPLTPVPFSLCHADGTMLKTDKSVLLKHLESTVENYPPSSIHGTIIDASFFLFLHSNLPSSFGAVSRVLLSKIMGEGSDVVHYVVDKWVQPSIKNLLNMDIKLV